MNIVDVAKQAKEIVKYDNKVFCPKCGKEWFSPFDKLFVTAYDICIICHPDNDEFLRKGQNITAVVIGWLEGIMNER